MYAILGLIGSVFHNFARVSYETGLRKGSGVPTLVYMFFGECSMMLLMGVFVMVSAQYFDLFLSWHIALLILCTQIGSIGGQFFMTEAYKSIRASDMIQFDNVDSLITILFGMLIFQASNSWIDAGFALGAVGVLLIVNFSTKKQSRAGKKQVKGLGKIQFIAGKTMKGANALLITYILTLTTVPVYSGMAPLTLMCILLGILITSGGLPSRSMLGLPSYKYALMFRALDKCFFGVAFVCGLFVVQKTGIVFATLIVMASFCVRLVIVRYMYKQSISRRELLAACGVLLCVGGSMVW